MPRVLALVRADLGAGFTLTGIDVTRVGRTAELAAALEEAVAAGTYGLIVVEEELMRGLAEPVRAAYTSLPVPLVIEIPGALAWQGGEEASAEEYVARLIRRAVGYQLNIKL